MGNCLKRHFNSAFFNALLNLKLLLLWGNWSFWFFFFFGCGLLSVGRSSISLLLFLRSSGFGTSTGLNGNLFLFLPNLSQIDALKLKDLVDIVFNANRKLCFAAWHVSLASLALSNFVLGDRIG